MGRGAREEQRLATLSQELAPVLLADRLARRGVALRTLSSQTGRMRPVSSNVSSAVWEGPLRAAHRSLGLGDDLAWVNTCSSQRARDRPFSGVEHRQKNVCRLDSTVAANSCHFQGALE